MEKLLTVIVPVYNTEKFLPHCLDTLIVPKYLEQLEVLVVIDGSPDNSVKVAKEYQTKYPNTFIVVEKENGGHGSALNKGLELATGKYFRMLDSDDWFDEINFEKYLDRLSSATEDLVMTHVMFEYVFENRKELWIDKDFAPRYVAYTDLSVLKKLPINFFAMARCTYRTSLLKKHNLFFLEHRSFEDSIMHVFPLLFIKSFVFYDLVIYHYFLGRPGQSVTQKISLKQCNDWRALIEQTVDFYLRNVDEFDAEKKSFILRALKYYINMLYGFMDKLSYKEAKKELRSYNSYIIALPFYPQVKSLKSICYNLFPYLAFRIGCVTYAKMRKCFRKRDVK